MKTNCQLWLIDLCYGFASNEFFHGVAFSIVFRKPFYFISTGNKAENRITSLLAQLGLSDRIISETQIPKFKPIDYKSPQPDGTSVEQKLYAMREFSQNWLKNALKGVRK